MNDTLYDTSYTLYSISEPSPAYRDLLNADQHRRNSQAAQLRSFLGANRPQYEREEEAEKIGGLRDVKCICLRKIAGHKRKRGSDETEQDQSSDNDDEANVSETNATERLFFLLT